MSHEVRDTFLITKIKNQSTVICPKLKQLIILPVFLLQCLLFGQNKVTFKDPKLNEKLCDLLFYIPVENINY